MSIRATLSVVFVLYSACLLHAQPGIRHLQVNAQPVRPRLVLAITVEQMRPEYLNRWGDLLDDYGIKWLFNKGLSCTKASYGYQFTQTAPAYATLFTGTDPATHGIVADSWYSSDLKAMTAATDDAHVFPTGGSYARGQHSPHYLQASTVGDAIKQGTGMKGKVYAISLQPDGAILPAGFMADGAFWFDTSRGIWMSSSFYMDKLPRWLQEINDLKPGDRVMQEKWTLLLPPQRYAGIEDKSDYEIGFSRQHTFPYDPKTLNDKTYTSDYEIVTAIPAGNSLVTELALKIIGEEKLGQDEYPDFLSVSYPVTEQTGRLFGPYSLESADTFARLDRDVALLISTLDLSIGLDNVLVVFTSTSGCADPPAMMADRRMSVGQFNSNSAISLLSSYLHVRFGDQNWLCGYARQQLYFDHALMESAHVEAGELIASAADFLADIAGVAHVYTASDMLHNSYTSGLARKFQQGYTKQRSGDVLFALQPGWIEKENATTSHNSSYGYDADVPLVFCGWEIEAGVIPGQTDMTSVAPTIMHALRLTDPNGSSGIPIVLK